MTRDVLCENGGPFELGAIVDLGETKPQPVHPETEDHLVRPGAVRKVERLDPDDYLQLLEEVADRRMRDIFGIDLMRREDTYAVNAGKGERSLGCVRAHRTPRLDVDGRGKLRLHFEDSHRTAPLPVNDLRFYEENNDTLRYPLVEDVNHRMQSGVGVWVMLGLGRPFRAWGDDAERHWLQVNGLCLEDRPLGAAP